MSSLQLFEGKFFKSRYENLIEFFAYCCSGRIPSINISYLFRFSFLLCEKFDLSITIRVFFCLSRYGDKMSSLHFIP